MSKQKLETAVIIIGAGPAGAGTSFFLSKHGIPHIVIDKDTFPRDKVCGDACSGKTALVIKRANPEWLDEILSKTDNHLPSWGIKFVAPNGKAIDIPFSPQHKKGDKAPTFTMTRLDFDYFLFKKMASPHCTVYEGAKVTEIQQVSTQKVVVNMTWQGADYEITAPVIVGADGDKSLVNRKLRGNEVSHKAYAVGLRAYYDGIADLHPEGFIELHFLPEIIPGYLWIFPLANGMANVGVGMLSEAVRDKGINLREKMLYAIKNNPNIAPRFANATLTDKIVGWGLPLASERKLMSGDNYILTGDAASLVDPFSGEGIGNALYSGMLAADAIKKAQDENNYSAVFFKEIYDDEIYRRFGDEFKLSTTLQRLCQYPWLFNLVVNKAYKSPSLRNTISCMFTDMDLREQLSKPSFYLKILFNR